MATLSEMGGSFKRGNITSNLPGEGQIINTGAGIKEQAQFRVVRGGQLYSLNQAENPQIMEALTKAGIDPNAIPQFNSAELVGSPFQVGNTIGAGVIGLGELGDISQFKPAGAQNVQEGPKTPAQLARIAELQANPAAREQFNYPITGPVQPQDSSIPERFQQGFEKEKAAGTTSPDTVQGAAEIIGRSLPETQQPDQVTGFLQTDPFLNNMMTGFQEYLGEQNQRVSLVQEYQNLLKSSGIEAIDTELLNMKNVIEGSEEDIRTEITKAGGFATESQVIALTNARNKQLIKNYNTLLETRNMKEKYLDNMLQLTVQDRAEADRRFDQMMNFGFKIADYQQKMQANAIASLDRTVNAIGWDGLLNATQGDPYTQSLIEKTYGLPSGGLQEAAVRDQENRQAEAEAKALDTAYKQAQIENIQSQIDERNKQGNYPIQTLNGKPLTDTQALSLGYGKRMDDADKVISELGTSMVDFSANISGSRFFPNFLKSPDRQRYEQAERNFVNAVLRRESGAAIAPSEFDSAAKQYFPQPGDSNAVIEQKRKNRDSVIRSMATSANVPLSEISSANQDNQSGGSYEDYLNAIK